jgi:hypothetical protein
LVINNRSRKYIAAITLKNETTESSKVSGIVRALIRKSRAVADL